MVPLPEQSFGLLVVDNRKLSSIPPLSQKQLYRRGVCLGDITAKGSSLLGRNNYEEKTYYFFLEKKT